MSGELSVAALLLENARLRSKLAEVQSALQDQRSDAAADESGQEDSEPLLPHSLNRPHSSSCGLSPSLYPSLQPPPAAV